jgi:hypothetical protein
VADSEDITNLIEAMVAGGGSRAEAFFIARGLGSAYASVDKGYGIRKHVNAALLRAEKDGHLAEVVADGLFEYRLADAKPVQTRQPRSNKGGSVATVSATGRVFISHASADKALADALADLIRLGTGLSHERILCTSLDGMGIPVGTKDYLEFLREQISDAGLVLPLFTPAFFDSEVCLIEVGAMWGLGMPRFPLLVPPVDFPRVEKLLGKVQGAKIDKSSGLSELHDQIIASFGLIGSTPMWEAKKAAFEKRLPGLLKKLTPVSRVGAADLKAVEDRAAQLEDQIAELDEKIERLEAQNRDLHAAKTAKEADAAIAPDDEIDRFRLAVKAATAALKELPYVVREAIYEDYGNNDLYRPDPHSDDSEGADQARKDDILQYNAEDGGYYPNRDDPSVQDAYDAIEDLFEVDWSEDLEDWFRREYRKNFAKGTQAVWEALALFGKRGWLG